MWYSFCSTLMLQTGVLFVMWNWNFYSFSESVESVQSQVRVSKSAVVASNEVGKQCITSQTNGLTVSAQESALRTQLSAPPMNESAHTNETESVPVRSWPPANILKLCRYLHYKCCTQCSRLEIFRLVQLHRTEMLKYDRSLVHISCRKITRIHISSSPSTFMAAQWYLDL